MSDPIRPTRKVYRNIRVDQLANYRLPPAGWVSILHRISGGVLFLLMPFVLYLYNKSITSELSFNDFRSVASHWFAKLVLLVLVWAYLQHFFAGVRHLAMDVHLGVEKDTGRVTALTVLALTAVVWVAFALKLFGVF